MDDPGLGGVRIPGRRVGRYWARGPEIPKINKTLSFFTYGDYSITLFYYNDLAPGSFANSSKGLIEAQ